MKRVLCGLAVAVAALLPSTASAATIDLFEWGFNIDGTVYTAGPVPGASGTPAASGAQGTINVTVSGAGAHDFVAYWDYELNELDNGYSDEVGSVNGAPSAGLRWETDDPGFGPIPGDIYDHFLAGSAALDNTNAAPNGPPDDVSAALGWSFILGAGETATISLLVSENAPGGFYLRQLDGDGVTDLYYSTSLRIDGGGPTPTPEPGTMLLLGLGLCAAGARRFRTGRAGAR